MSQPTLKLVLSSVCPWLILVLGLQGLAGCSGVKARGWGRLSGLGLIAAGPLMLPVQAVAVADWVRGLSANFSLPFTGLLAVAVWQIEFHRPLFARRDWFAGWTFGALAGLALYPFALGLGRFDPYEWGWGFSPLFVMSAVLTAWLLWKYNRFGLLLLLAIGVYHLRLLESRNYWDYLLDPVYCLASIVALGWQLLARVRQAPSASAS
jgi:hypothetical protein